jgi:hypothetical protein
MSEMVMSKEEVVEQYKHLIGNKKPLKVKQINYIRRNGKVLPHEKIVLEKLEEDCYRRFLYRWDSISSEWYISKTSSLYDGENLNEIGALCITRNNIERFFELLVKYSGFKYMEPDEANTDKVEELARVAEVNKQPTGYGMFGKAGVLGNNMLQLDMGEIREILSYPDGKLTDADIEKLRHANPGDRVKLSDGWTYSICNEPHRYNGVII